MDVRGDVSEPRGHARRGPESAREIRLLEMPGKDIEPHPQPRELRPIDQSELVNRDRVDNLGDAVPGLVEDTAGGKLVGTRLDIHLGDRRIEIISM